MTMPRLRDPAAVASLARRGLQWIALDRAAFAPFVLGVPTLRPRPDDVRPEPALAMLLQPHQYQLWRRRAVAVLGRLFRVAAVYALLSGLLRLRLAPDLPWPVCWLPVLLLLCYGCALARRQRPGLYETACLLDRRYGLHELLGTAAELRSPYVTSGLPALNMATALDAARRLPERPWEGGDRHRGRSILVLALAVSALAVWIAGPQPASVPPLAQQRTPWSHTAPRLAQLVTRAEPGFARAHRAGTPVLPRTARVPAALNPFVTSLQMHAGPPLASAPAVASSQAPATSLQGQLGAGPGGSQGGSATSPGGAPRSIAGSGSGQPSAAQPAPAPSQRQPAASTGGSGGNAGRQPQQAQQGSGSSPGAQNPNMGGQQPAGSTQAGASQGAPSGSPAGANPFGQDPRASSGSQSASGRSTGGAARRAPSGTTQGRPRTPPTSQRTQPSSGGAAAGEGMDPRVGRHAHTGGSTQQHAQAPVRQAGAARGPQIVLGSGKVSQAQAADPQLVRVLPSGSSSTSGLQATGQLGPQRVQGYVPEDATRVSPEEQALLLAYFAQKGSGS